MLLYLTRGVLEVDGRYVIVVIVPVEQGLHRVPPQKHRVLPHLLFIIVLPVAISVLGIEVVLVGRHEGGRDLPGVQIIPVVSLEPYVVLDLLWAVQAKAVDRLPLNQLVDEVGRLEAPACGNLVLADLHLLGEDVVSDLLTCLAYVRALTIHALVADDTHGEVVNCHPVILSTHHLWRHVPGGPRGVFCVV